MMKATKAPNSGGRPTKQHKATATSFKVVLTCVGCCIISFYSGLILGLNHSVTDQCRCTDEKPERSSSSRGFWKGKRTRFPKQMEKLFAGAARVNRDEFTKRFDLGVPLDQTQQGNEEILMLYHHPQSLSNVSTTVASDGDQDMPLLSVRDATINCETLKIILTEPNKKHECLAIVGQWESYHIHKYMRLPPDQIRTGIDHNLPLRSVSRTHSARKGKTQIIPKHYNVERYDSSILVPYLSSLKKTLEDLKPIARKVAKNNTIVVLVCNLGQSELLVNFICNARAKGFDLSQVLVFATDLETKKIVEGLGVAAFHDEVNSEKMPEQAARTYGDGKFTAMMMAKVFCVHLISQLEYNVLFQDVDVVWHQNPVDYFLNESSPHYDFDMYFQDDGAHSVRYAPYSPNTGFYFVRAVDRTRYFFSCFVKLGDMIQQSGSHQSALTSLLNEHVSYRGLKVKIFSRDEDEFPGGFHYHRRKDYMKKMIQNKVHPYIFHMSWTNNKENKRKFFQQLGEWYVQLKCVGKKVDEIKIEQSVFEDCCSANPIVECHYRDKPSKIPCKDKPPIDKNRASWW